MFGIRPNPGEHMFTIRSIFSEHSFAIRPNSGEHLFYIFYTNICSIKNFYKKFICIRSLFGERIFYIFYFFTQIYFLLYA